MFLLRPQFDKDLLNEIGFVLVESQILKSEQTKKGKELIRQFLIHAIK